MEEKMAQTKMAQTSMASNTTIAGVLSMFGLTLVTFIGTPTDVTAQWSCWQFGENFGMICRNENGPGPPCQNCAEDACDILVQTENPQDPESCESDCAQGAASVCFAGQ
jgi:hypothetical protein